jgi:hypothetical protein
MIDKRNLSERDICTQFITPAITAAVAALRGELKNILAEALQGVHSK